MIRGLRFTIPNLYQHYFTDILDGVDIERYTWHTGGGPNEIFMEDHTNLFDKSEYSGKEFRALISNISEYYVVFTTIAAFLHENPDSLPNYSNYQKESCQLVLTCCDCEWAEIYCRDPELIKIIEQNAVDHNYTEIEYITEENDNYGYFHSLGGQF